MPPRLTSADLVGRLRGAGYTLKDIGQILGRSKDMAYKVGAGKSDPPGYREALKRAWDNVNNRQRHGRKRATAEQLKKVAPTPPPRRQATGKEARLRHGVWKMQPRWALGLVGGQAARSGASALLAGVEYAHARMWRLSVTVAFRERRTPRPEGARRGSKYYPPKHVPEGLPKKFKTWLAGCQMIPRDVLQMYGDRDDGNLLCALLDYMKAEQVIDFDDPRDVLPDVERVEMRIWAP